MTDRKSRLSLVSLLLCALLLWGCGAQAGDKEATVTAAMPQPSAAPSAPAEETEAPDNPERTDTASNMLVVWFSATGTTERIALQIADMLGADTYAIVPETPYTDADLNYGDSGSRTTVEQNNESARPAIAGTLPDVTFYDTVFLGYPIWHGQAPRVLSTFLEGCNLTGKTVVPFCTSGSSGVGSSAENLHPLAAGANWMEGKRFPGNATSEEIAAWANSFVAADALRIEIGNTVLTATLADNSSAAALKELLSNGPLTIHMHDYGNFEKVGELGATLPRNDEEITTEPGDIILYQGNQMTIYYDRNTWNFTRLGKINGVSAQALRTLLGAGDVTVTLRLLGSDGESASPRFDLASGKAGCAPTVTLNSGYAMPILGLGTWTQDDETAGNSVYHALRGGYRLIDTAKYYGNEAGIGAAVRRAIDEGIVTREEVFITSKIVPSGSDTDYKAAITGCNDRLGLGYIDLMLIHQQGAGEEALYSAIEDAIDGGIVHSLGISNYYTPEDFDRITAGMRVMPAVIQNENHPFYQNTELQGYVAQFGTVIESYYPFGGRGHTNELFNAEPITAIAQSHGKTSAQILVRWHLQAGYIAIPGSSNPDHIAENFDVFGFTLSGEEMERIAGMDTGKRYENW